MNHRAAATAVVVLLLGAAVPSMATTVTARLAELAPARDRLVARFAAAEIAYPPTAVTLVALKSERVLEVQVKERQGTWHAVVTFPILALGPQIGPKLCQGDGRTPEGIYRLTALNPDSKFHLSLMIDYPSAEDRAQAVLDGRDHLGGDIVIHGEDVSAGCIAIGNDAVEELFILVADVGLPACDIIVAPRDLRQQPLGTTDEVLPEWVRNRYRQMARRLAGVALE